MRSRPAVFLCSLLLVLALAGLVGVARAQALDFRLSHHATGQHPRSVAVGDFNNDGKPDLVTANWGSDTVSVLLGNGSGDFAARLDAATGDYPVSVAVADFDKDGNRDLATANADANTVSVLLGDGAGGFATKTDFATGDSPQSVATGDLNRDGDPDLVASNWSGYTVGVRLGDGSGGFGPRTDFTIGAGMFYIRSVVIVDLDNDGKQDVATSNHTRTYSPFPPHSWQFDYSGVFVRLGNGDGTLAGGNGLGEQMSFPTDYGPLALAAADLNGDGRKDLVTANYEANTISLLLQQSTLTDVAVGNPVAPPVMYKGRAKTVYGSLKPRHAAGTYPVLIYRWKRTPGGAWKSYGFVKARVADYSSYSRYSKALSFPARGKWRIRAYHPACSLHVAKWSAKYDYVTVK